MVDDYRLNRILCIIDKWRMINRHKYPISFNKDIISLINTIKEMEGRKK